MELTNEQWEKLKDLTPDPVRRTDRSGKPAREKREVLEGVLWILRTSAPWKDLPVGFPPYQSCHRRFQWLQQGVMQQVVEALARDLQERGGVDLSEFFIDSSFCMAKKGALLLARLERGIGTKLMAVTQRCRSCFICLNPFSLSSGSRIGRAGAGRAVCRAHAPAVDRREGL